MKKDEMSRASDQHLLNFFNELSDETEWNHPVVMVLICCLVVEVTLCERSLRVSVKPSKSRAGQNLSDHNWV